MNALGLPKPGASGFYKELPRLSGRTPASLFCILWALTLPHLHCVLVLSLTWRVVGEGSLALAWQSFEDSVMVPQLLVPCPWIGSASVLLLLRPDILTPLVRAGEG